MSRFIIGLDLGTTNSAVSYIDTHLDDQTPCLFDIPQIMNSGECEDLNMLPSFLYLPSENELQRGGFRLPWNDEINHCVGIFARKSASTLPGQVVASAKSWLCASNIDRFAKILPWNGPIKNKLSPIDVAREYLEHIKAAWNYKHSDDEDDAKFENQKIVLTVPASFDVVARELTVKAAELAGLAITLIEEPLAAFYAWIHENEANWRDQVEPGDIILVCDIGGGTTDFSLIQVIDDDGKLDLHRIAVGKHILLGGDNLDLTLAYAIAEKISREKEIKLDQQQMVGLTHGCREAKEILFSDPASSPQTLTILGSGSSIIGGTISAELSFDELNQLIIEGFFPSCELDSQPSQNNKAGLRVFGLNYESEPAITKHLAHFISSHAKKTKTKTELNLLPNIVLFNGGVTKAKYVQDRISDILQQWRRQGDESVKILTDSNPDLAVAKGASWFGMVCQGEGIKIKSGSAHSYYVGVESSMPAIPGFKPPVEALCVVPFGMNEGTELIIPYSGLGLVIGESTEFKFFLSNNRNADREGQIVKDSEVEELLELPPVVATLPAIESEIPAGTLAPINLKAVLSDIGTLQLWCIENDGEGQWKLEYELRDIGV